MERTEKSIESIPIDKLMEAARNKGLLVEGNSQKGSIRLNPQAVHSPSGPKFSNANVRNKVIVSLKVYHQLQGENAIGDSIGRVLRVSSIEEPYCRKMKIGEDWTKLDTGWIEEPGLVIIENLALPKRNRTRLSQVEIDKIDSENIVQITNHIDTSECPVVFWDIKPGMPFIGQCNNLKDIHFRALSFDAHKVEIYVMVIGK